MLRDCFPYSCNSYALSRLALIRNAVHCRLEFLVGAEVGVTERPELIIQLINQWYSRGDIEPDNLGIADILQILDQRTQAVAVRDNDNEKTHTASYLAGHDLIPALDDSLHCILQTFRVRQFRPLDTCIGRIIARNPPVTIQNDGRANFITSSPEKNPLFAVQGGSLSFVETCESPP